MTLDPGILTNDGRVTPTGILLNILPAPSAPLAPVELWRAPNSAGAPGTYALIVTFPRIGTGVVYFDALPLDGAIYWYKQRVNGGAFGPSAFTPDYNAGAAAVIDAATLSTATNAPGYYGSMAVADGITTAGALQDDAVSPKYILRMGTGISDPDTGDGVQTYIDFPSSTNFMRVGRTPQLIAAAANNGSGLIRLTVTGHGYATGDVVTVRGHLGVTNANGPSQTITVIDNDNFDLQGSTFAGTDTPNTGHVVKLSLLIAPNGALTVFGTIVASVLSATTFLITGLLSALAGLLVRNSLQHSTAGGYGDTGFKRVLLENDSFKLMGDAGGVTNNEAVRIGDHTIASTVARSTASENVPATGSRGWNDPDAAPTAVTYTLTGGTTWVVPQDWNNANNSIECYGAGGGGGAGQIALNGGGGGGGGEWRKATNVTLTPGASIAIQIGSGGGAGSGSGGNGSAGSDTKFQTTTVIGKGGQGGTGAGGSGAGGTGGTGAAGATNGGAGGTGASGSANEGGGGGGGCRGGAGGNGSAGSGGAGGTAGSGIAGAGGAGKSGAGAGNAGNLYGGGGGGGGSSASDQGNGGAGKQGAIVIIYTAAADNGINLISRTTDGTSTVAAANRLYQELGDATEGANIPSYDNNYNIQFKVTADATAPGAGNVTATVTAEYATDGTGTTWTALSGSWSVGPTGSLANQVFNPTFIVPGSPAHVWFRLTLAITTTSQSGGIASGALQCFVATYKTDNYAATWATAGTTFTRRGAKLFARSDGVNQMPHAYMEPLSAATPDASAAEGEVEYVGSTLHALGWRDDEVMRYVTRVLGVETNVTTTASGDTKITAGIKAKADKLNAAKRTLKIRAGGTIGANTGTINLRLGKLGTTGDAAIATLSLASNDKWMFDVVLTITAAGSSGTARVSGYTVHGTTLALVSGTFTLDTTADQLVNLTGLTAGAVTLTVDEDLVEHYTI